MGWVIEMWTDVLEDDRSVRAIYGEDIPSLRGIELQEVTLSQLGPSVELRVNLAEFPASPPKKWADDHLNQVQILLHATAVSSLQFDAPLDTTAIEMEVTREGQNVKIVGRGPGMSFSVVAGFLLLTKVQAFRVSEV